MAQRKKVNILFQMGLEKESELEDVPTILDRAKTSVDRKVLELLFTPLEMGRPLYAPPGIPSERAAALRVGLEQALKDPLLVADADRMGCLSDV